MNPFEPSFPAPAAPVTLSPEVEQVKTLLQVAEDALKMVSELRAEKAAIREAYYQYQFFADGYANGSASISEVRAAHDKFTALL
jgi:hypothetical protein